MTLKQIVEAGSVGGRNLLFGSSPASLSLITRPRQMIQYVADSLFLHRAMSGRRGVAQKNVAEVLSASGPQSIRLGNLDMSPAWFWPQALYTQDIVSLCLICQIRRPQLVFEIGTLSGYTAYRFALNTPDETRICTLDLPRDGSAKASLPTGILDGAHIRERSAKDPYCFDGTREARKITCLSGDSATFDFTPYHGQVDVFFIDGAHSYDYVRFGYAERARVLPFGQRYRVARLRETEPARLEPVGGRVRETVARLFDSWRERRVHGRRVARRSRRVRLCQGAAGRRGAASDSGP